MTALLMTLFRPAFQLTLIAPRLLALLAIPVVEAGAAEVPQPIRGKNYKLIFEDNFDGPAGSPADPAKWKPLMASKWRDAWNMEDAARLDGHGNLAITMRRNGDRIETGYIGTSGKFQATHGYYEIRCRVLNTKGAWCAFWSQSPTLGEPLGDSSKAGVELDIIEYFGPHWEHKDHARHTAHWDGYGKEHKAEGVDQHYPEITKKFCTFAMKWDEEGYVFYVDGIESPRMKTAPLSNRPQYLILSCEVAKWCGKIEEAVLPDAFTVDYVRVWQTPVQIANDAKRPVTISANKARHLLEAQGLFKWLDKDKDQQLSKDELLSVRQNEQGGLDPFASTDRNGDNQISRDEYLFPGEEPIASLDKVIADALETERPMRESAFKDGDLNKDGLLSKEEFMVPRNDKAEGEKRFGRFDKDQNGNLSAEEFVSEGR